MFIVGEYIQKRDNELLATVLTCERVDNTTPIYRVEVDDAIGYDKYIFVTEYTWMPYVPHAHIATCSRDCDEEYLSESTRMPTDEERRSIFGDMTFKRRVIFEAIGLSGFGGTLDLDGDTFTWHETTDAGYLRICGTWCYDCDETDKSPSFRDLVAEAAGY